MSKAREGAPPQQSTGNLPALVSIIIPVLDEERTLPACLSALALQEGPLEIIVVDGGSKDATSTIARYAGAHVINSPPGRACQMNSGANLASGTIYLFLHADTLIPPNALSAVRRTLASGRKVGAFSLRFDRNALSFKFAAFMADIYCHLTNSLFGDRAIFCTRQAFEAAGGYPEVLLMEDLALAMKWKRMGFRPGLIPEQVTTSGRRFEKLGILRGCWLGWKLCHAFHKDKALDSRATTFYTSRAR